MKLSKIALIAISAMTLGTSANASLALEAGTYVCKSNGQTEFYHLWRNGGILQTQVVVNPRQSRADDLLIYGKWKQISKTKIKLYDHDIFVMRKIVDAAKENGVDAIIAFDFACVNYCNEIGVPVHMSVQFSISNYETVEFFAQFTNRVVLARELNLEQIENIYQQIEKIIYKETRIEKWKLRPLLTELYVSLNQVDVG